MKHIVSFTLNGNDTEVICDDNTTLLDLLRDQIGLTGTKKGCEEGECGACTVMIDGRPINSCVTLARQVEGCNVVTIEGLAVNGVLTPVQQQFIDNWAFQCGYCTPGMVLAIKKLLDEHPDPTESEIKYGLAGNICRCTGYVSIENAVKKAAAVLRGE